MSHADFFVAVSPHTVRYMVIKMFRAVVRAPMQGLASMGVQTITELTKQ